MQTLQIKMKIALFSKYFKCIVKISLNVVFAELQIYTVLLTNYLI